MLAPAWLALHAVVLGLVLGLKFLTAKAIFVLAIAAAGLGFLFWRRPRLPRLQGVV